MFSREVIDHMLILFLLTKQSYKSIKKKYFIKSA
jgi:hypothetical protein